MSGWLGRRENVQWYLSRAYGRKKERKKEEKKKFVYGPLDLNL